MRLTINISAEAESLLKQQVAARARDPGDYASEIVERHLGCVPTQPPISSDLEQARLSALAEELIRRSEQLKIPASFPRLRGQEAEIAASMARNERERRRKDL